MHLSNSPSSPSVRQRRKEARPQELLDAALALFVEKGFAATRIEEVAERAGVSKGTLYLYYPSKEELLKAVVREELSLRIEEAAEEVRQYTGSVANLLRTMLPEWWLRVYDSPAAGVLKLFVTEVRSFPEIAEYYVREVIAPNQMLVGSLVQRGIDAGEFKAVDVDSAVHSLVLPMVMLCVHKHSLGACTAMPSEIDPQVFIRQHMALVVNGLSVKPEQKSALPQPVKKEPNKP
jgi:AcrR family transcriptional regulator